MKKTHVFKRITMIPYKNNNMGDIMDARNHRKDLSGLPREAIKMS